MFTKDKRFPAFTDDDPMLFGKYKGKLLIDVPASYLSWLKNSLEQDGCNKLKESGSAIDLEKLKLYNYILNSWEAIKEEGNL